MPFQIPDGYFFLVSALPEKLKWRLYYSAHFYSIGRRAHELFELVVRQNEGPLYRVTLPELDLQTI